MNIKTTRFGTVSVQADDLFEFPAGLIGFEDCQRWVLLADAENNAVGWLQSATRPEVAMPLVSPRRFVPDYHVRVPRSEMAALQLDEVDRAFVLNIVARNVHGLTINLKAPLLFNLDQRLGCQLVTSDDQPLQWALEAPILKLRKSA